MAPKGTPTHAGIDQQGPGHGVDQLRPEFSLRKHPQIGPPMAAKEGKTQPVIQGHILVNHPSPQAAARQLGRTSRARGQQQAGTRHPFQLLQQGQQADQFTDAGGMQPHQLARGAATPA